MAGEWWRLEHFRTRLRAGDGLQSQKGPSESHLRRADMRERLEHFKDKAASRRRTSITGGSIRIALAEGQNVEVLDCSTEHISV